MKELAVYLVKSFIAGIMIAIGGTVFLSVDNKIIGAGLFSIGLFMIVTNQLNLYTGKIGYVLENNLKYGLEVVVTLIGNFLGTFFSSFLLKYTRIYPMISDKAKSICKIKLSDTALSIFILAFFCGILMYLAVNGFKTKKDNIGKYGSVFLCVMVFILCGFEHSIANMYYFSIANILGKKTFISLIIMILGNSVGGIFIPMLEKLKKWEK